MNYSTLMLVEMEIRNMELRRSFPGKQEALARLIAQCDRLLAVQTQG
jgi:hypothetical protein